MCPSSTRAPVSPLWELSLMLVSYVSLAFFAVAYCLAAAGLWAPLGRDRSGAPVGSGALALIFALLILLFAAAFRRLEWVLSRSDEDPPPPYHEAVRCAPPPPGAA